MCHSLNLFPSLQKIKIMKIQYLFIFLVFSLTSSAQDDFQQKIKQQFYNAYLSNTPQIWEDGIQKLNRLYQESNKIEVLYQITHAEFGIIRAYMGKGDKESATKWIEKAEEHANILLEKNKDWPEALALMANILSIKVGLNPMSGMTLGPKSERYAKRAMKKNDQLPEVWSQRAGSYYHTPKMFGGSIKKAVENYEKTVALYERNIDALHYNWNYLDALAWLGQAYTKNEDYNQAKMTYEKALRVAPDFGWVKHVLLPSVEKKIE